jgi:hypothetical protein
VSGNENEREEEKEMAEVKELTQPCELGLVAV